MRAMRCDAMLSIPIRRSTGAAFRAVEATTDMATIAVGDAFTSGYCPWHLWGTVDVHWSHIRMEGVHLSDWGAYANLWVRTQCRS